jgi:hypothetical protein
MSGAQDLLLGNFSTAAAGYQIERSLRFNSADSAYLNRTPASASNRKTWTWSGWVKRCVPTTTNTMFASDVDANNFFAIWFREEGDNGRLEVLNFSTTYDMRIETTQVFRDVSAWYHLVVAIDTTQATSTNRVKIYINGSQVTALSTTTYPSQNFDTDVNNTNSHKIGVQGASYGLHNGYLTEINFIDGQALTPSSFGETDSATGVWKPKAYSGTYGTNGFYLNFSDNASTTTLGDDFSGNGNDWTTNNFSVTAGAGNDSMVDSPTAYGTDTGVGGSVRGNYATLNSAWPSTVNVTDGNLKLSMATNNRGAVGTIAIPIGTKIYFEATFADAGSFDQWVGIIGPTATVTNTRGDWNNTTAYGLTHDNSTSSLNPITAGVLGSSVGTPVNGDVFGVAVDRVNNEIKVYQNNTLRTTISISATETYFPACGVGGGTDASIFIVLNFGQRAFAYTAPSGFKALCTTNLPTPTIGATSTTLANKYFDVSLWAGTGVAQNITNSGSMQPDFVWTKTRSQANDHFLFDAIRGVGNYLRTNSTGAEATVAQTLTAFNSNGFSVGTDNDTNASGRTFVGWQWNAGGSNATNNSGTITSTVRASTTSGFSIVTYTGTGSAATVGHGLGVAPAMVIVKDRTQATTWWVYHTSIGATKYLELNSTAASGTSSTAWNDTAPTSTVFSVGTNTSENTKNYIAYCFAPVAGYSAFGSYTGNGSADGPFVYTGFRPRFVLMKYTNTTSYWIIFDTARSTYNLVTAGLRPNDSAAENTNLFAIDVLSNGFKVRDSGGLNGSGDTTIYAAIAESPFKYSLAR